MLSFRLAVGEEGAQVSLSDVVIKGDGFRVAASISAQGNPIPSTLEQDYAFLLHEHPNYQWTPTLTPMEFQRMLANITAIRIRGTYAEQGNQISLNIVQWGTLFCAIMHLKCRAIVRRKTHISMVKSQNDQCPLLSTR